MATLKCYSFAACCLILVATSALIETTINPNGDFSLINVSPIDCVPVCVVCAA